MLKKRFFKYFVFFLMFISFNNVVFAEASLFSQCGEGCLPICLYGPQQDDDPLLEAGYSETVLWGYHYGNLKELYHGDDLTTIMYELSWLKNDPFIGIQYDNVSSVGIPDANRLVWNKSSINGRELWHAGARYVFEKFNCPEGMTFDGNDLCAAENLSDCNFYSGTGNYILKYDFSKEVTFIIDNLYYSKTPPEMQTLLNNDSWPQDVKNAFQLEYYFYSSIYPPKDITNSIDFKLLHEFDIEFNENDIKSSCSYLGKKDDSYIESLVSKDAFKNTINNLLTNFVKKGYYMYPKCVRQPELEECKNKNIELVSVRDTSIYEYDKLIDIFHQPKATGTGTDTHAIYNGFGVYRDYAIRLNGIVLDPLTDSLSALKEKCQKEFNVDINLDVDSSKEQAAEMLEKEYSQSLIDFDKEFNCSEFFTEDLAKLISNAYFAIEIGALIIFVTLTVLDYAKVILNSDQDGMKKANKTIVIRLIVVVTIFLLPAIINLILGIFNVEGFNSDHPLCVEIKNK